MSQHLVIFTPIVQWPVHFETDLELAQLHLDQGGRVTFLHCRGALPVCAQNPGHRTSVCRKCVSRFQRGISWLGRDRVAVREFQSLTGGQRELVDALCAAQFRSLDELVRFTLEGSPIGLAVFGSVVSFLREPQPDLRQHEALFSAYLKMAALSFFSIKNQLSSLAPDRFVLFNGRFAELRVALYAARELGIPSYVHERAGVLERYSLSCNSSPHDLSAMIETMEALYRDSSFGGEEKERIAGEWYAERRGNKAQGWYSFTERQQAGLLPDFAQDRLNLVIFNSSEDEIESFPEWRNPLYRDQNEATERICRDLAEDGRFKLFLRVHPNLSNIDNSQTRGIERLAALFPELTVIAADSPMSSYGILDACDLVLVFGSTVGIEAVHAGKPTFLAGRAFYEELGGCVVPGSHEELIALLSSYAGGERSMLPAPAAARLAAAKYGFFQKLWGHTYQYVRPCHVGKSLLLRNGRETRLRPSLASWLVDRAVTLLARR